MVLKNDVTCACAGMFGRMWMMVLTLNILTLLVNGTKNGACFTNSDALLFSVRACIKIHHCEERKVNAKRRYFQ